MTDEDRGFRLPYGLEIVRSSALSALLTDRDTLQARCDALSKELDALAADFSTLTTERDALIAERAALVTDRDSLRGERYSLTLRNDTLVGESEALAAEITALIKERDALTAERGALAIDSDFLRAERHSLTLRNDALVGENERLTAEITALINQKEALAASTENIVSLENTALLADRLEQLGSFLQMKRVDNFPMTRVGGPFDGGYVCVEDFKGLSAAVSVGIGTDVSWDTAIANTGLVVHQYDHTVSGPPEPHANFRFHPVRLVPRDGDVGITIGSILESNDLHQPASVIGKVDIEGDEWDVLSSVSTADLASFSQFICEFHWLSRLADSAFFEKVLLTFRHLAEVFEPVHVHANNWSPLVRIGNKLFPDVLEITFANRQRYALSVSEEVFPTSIDAPNARHLPDYALGKFRY